MKETPAVPMGPSAAEALSEPRASASGFRKWNGCRDEGEVSRTNRLRAELLGPSAAEALSEPRASASGFRKWNGCFMTSAKCHAQGVPR